VLTASLAFVLHVPLPAVKEVWSLLAPGGFSFFPSRRGRSARMSFFFFCSLPCWLLLRLLLREQEHEGPPPAGDNKRTRRRRAGEWATEAEWGDGRIPWRENDKEASASASASASTSAARIDA
jgi:hypothetical protein